MFAATADVNDCFRKMWTPTSMHPLSPLTAQEPNFVGRVMHGVSLVKRRWCTRACACCRWASRGPYIWLTASMRPSPQQADSGEVCHCCRTSPQHGNTPRKRLDLASCTSIGRRRRRPAPVSYVCQTDSSGTGYGVNAAEWPVAQVGRVGWQPGRALQEPEQMSDPRIWMLQDSAFVSARGVAL